MNSQKVLSMHLGGKRLWDSNFFNKYYYYF